MSKQKEATYGHKLRSRINDLKRQLNFLKHKKASFIMPIDRNNTEYIQVVNKIRNCEVELREKQAQYFSITNPKLL